MIPQIADFEVEPIIRDGRVVDFNVAHELNRAKVLFQARTIATALGAPAPDILHELPDPIAAGLVPGHPSNDGEG